MRVVHLCHLDLPPSHPDYGRLQFHPGRWVLNLALAQKAHTRIDPVLVVPTPGTSAGHTTTIEGIPVEFVSIPDRFRSATLFEVDRRVLARHVLAHQPALVHAHGTEESFVLAAQTTGKPYAVTLQGVFAIINRELPPPLVSRARVIEFLERRALKKARHVIAKSDYIEGKVRALFPHLVLHRIPNTFDPRLLDVREAKIPGSAVFVGMVTPRKGLHLLVDILRQNPEPVPGFSLHIVGNRGIGTGEYDRMIFAELSRILGSRLVLHGIVPSLEAAQLAARCEIMLAPSLEEMFGNQLIESLLVGTWPVVSSNTAMAENVRRFGAGLIFENGSSAALAEAVTAGFAAQKNWDARDTREAIVREMGPLCVARAHADLYGKILQGG